MTAAANACAVCGRTPATRQGRRCACGASLVVSRGPATPLFNRPLTIIVVVVVVAASAGILAIGFHTPLPSAAPTTPSTSATMPPATPPPPPAPPPSAENYIIVRSRCGIQGRGEHVELRFEKRPTRATADALLSYYAVGLNQWSQVTVTINAGDDYLPIATENCDGTPRLYPPF